MTAAGRPDLAVLVHRDCGHIAGVVHPDLRAVLDEQRKRLAACGFLKWCVEVRHVTDAELAGVVAGQWCGRCTLVRARLL